MKLTNKQITEKEQTLIMNGIIYDDIKLEVTDHIASEIEAKMEESSISFDDALYQVLLNWKEQLKPSWSYLLGSNLVAPRIITQNCHSTVQKQLFISLLVSLLLTFIMLEFIRNFNNEKVIMNLVFVFRILCLISSLLILISRIMIWQKKYSTSFGFLFKRSPVFIPIYLILFGFNIIPFNDLFVNMSLNSVFIFFPLLLFIGSIFSLQFAYKHFQFEKKSSISYP